MSAPAAVLAHGLRLDLRSRPVVVDVDLIAQGGLTCVLGANGSGKTSLLRCLATVLLPDRGSLTVDGLDPHHHSDRVEIRRRLGYLPQEPGLAPRARVIDVVEYLAVCKGVRDDRRRRHLAATALDEVGLGDRAGDRIRDLSGGMRRRVGLAQALLGSPTLLVLDEPSVALDLDERARLRSIVAARRDRTTVVMSTHLVDEAAVADRVVVLAHGSVRYSGPPAGLVAAAGGKVWVQDEPPAGPVRASVKLADGRHRCIGEPPPGATLVAPTLEDGWLVVTGDPSRPS